MLDLSFELALFVDESSPISFDRDVACTELAESTTPDIVSNVAKEADIALVAGPIIVASGDEMSLLIPLRATSVFKL